eukprot:gene5842-9665_t
MKEQTIAKLHLEYYLKDEINFYSICGFNSEEFYLCGGSHFFYLFHESFQKKPHQFSYEQINNIIIDPSSDSFLISLAFGDKEQEIILETGDRDSTINEILIRCKADSIMKTWSYQKERKDIVLIKEIPNARKPVPLSKIIDLEKGFKIFELNSYHILIDEKFKEKKMNEKLPYFKTHFENGKENLSIISLPPREISQKLNLKELAERISTTNLIKQKEDYSIQFLKSQKKKTLFSKDLSIWDHVELLIETENEKIYFSCLRRMYLPSDTEQYQDFFIELKIPKNYENEKDSFEKFKKSIKSLNSSPQEFLYDFLYIRAKLESLNGDEEYYNWTNKILNLKPDLLPLKVTNNKMKIPLNYSRADIFAKNLSLVLGIKDIGTNIEQISDIFFIEQNILENTDSPDTINSPSKEHQIKRRFKLSKYLAYYCTEGFDSKLNTKKIIEKIKNSETTKQELNLLNILISYFIHLHQEDVLFSFKNETFRMVNELKKVVEVCVKNKKEMKVKLNSNFLIKLMKFDYFLIPSVEMNYKDCFADFFTIVFHCVDSNQHVNQICQELARIIEINDDFKSYLINEDFLTVLSEFLLSNDYTLLYTVGTLFVNLSVNSKNIKKWIVSSNCLTLILEQIQSSKLPQKLLSLYSLLLKNCMEEKESRDLMVENNVIPTLVSLLNLKLNENSTNERISLLERVTRNIWILSPDEIVCNLLVQNDVISILINLLKSSNFITLNTNICGILLVISSFDDFRDFILKSESLNVIIKLIENHSSEYKKDENNEEFYLKFLKNSCGALMMLSSNQLAKQKMKELNLSNILEELKNDIVEIENDTTVNTIFSKILNHLDE